MPELLPLEVTQPHRGGVSQLVLLGKTLRLLAQECQGSRRAVLVSKDPDGRDLFRLDAFNGQVGTALCF